MRKSTFCENDVCWIPQEPKRKIECCLSHPPPPDAPLSAPGDWVDKAVALHVEAGDVVQRRGVRHIRQSGHLKAHGPQQLRAARATPHGAGTSRHLVFWGRICGHLSLEVVMGVRSSLSPKHKQIHFFLP